MTRTARFALTSLALLTSLSVHAQKISDADKAELSWVAKTVEMAKHCKIAPAKYPEFAKFEQVAKKAFVASGFGSAQELDKAFQAGREEAKKERASWTAARCQLLEADIVKVNKSFEQQNKMLEAISK